jgi:hypothetical protein
MSKTIELHVLRVKIKGHDCHGGTPDQRASFKTNNRQRHLPNWISDTMSAAW